MYKLTNQFWLSKKKELTDFENIHIYWCCYPKCKAQLKIPEYVKDISPKIDLLENNEFLEYEKQLSEAIQTLHPKIKVEIFNAHSNHSEAESHKVSEEIKKRLGRISPQVYDLIIREDRAT